MIQDLLNVPRTPQEWSNFSFNNYLDHQLIDAGLKTKKKVMITSQVIDPISWNDIANWLARHQILHNDEAGPLGLQVYDLQSVDLLNPQEAAAWIWLHWISHSSAHTNLGI